MMLMTSCNKTSQPVSRTGYISCNVCSEDTKGSVVSETDIQSGGFYLTAYLDDEYYKEGDEETATGPKGAYIGSVTSPSSVSYVSSAWTISGNPKWVVIDSMRFWCWYPKTLSAGTRTISTDDLTGRSTLNFTYTMPDGGATSGSPAVACDATNQTDLLFAYNCRWYEPGKSGSDSEEVNLRFYHALSQINFIVYPKAKDSQTTDDGSLRNDYGIVDIALQGMSTSGSCTITGKPYYEEPAEKANKTTFAWSGQSGNGTYTQYYGTSFASASSSNVPGGWTYKDYDGKAHFFCNNSFFIIPEAIAEGAAVSVTFLQGDTKVTKLAKLKGVGTSDKTTPVTAWLPGYRYTYRLSISGDITDPTELSVTLEDWEAVNDSMRF